MVSQKKRKIGQTRGMVEEKKERKLSAIAFCYHIFRFRTDVDEHISEFHELALSYATFLKLCQR